MSERRGWPDGPFADRDGNPIDFPEWARLRWLPRGADPSYHLVAVDELPGDRRLSTVWVGSAYLDEDPPAIFETHELPNGHGPWRWTTEQRARDGHAAILAALRAGRQPDIHDDLDREDR